MVVRSQHVGGLHRVVGDEGYWLGETEGDLPNHTPAPEADFCPIRFQGQWEDAETGLYYNRFRYYEPAVGQYVSSDPIGLIGGYRAWGYVESVSIWIDPWGLAPCGPRKVPIKWNGQPGRDGCCRKEHVLKHGADALEKDLHGIFKTNPLNATRQAWQVARVRTH